MIVIPIICYILVRQRLGIQGKIFYESKYRQLRARRALLQIKDVPLRTRRALLPLTLYSNSTLLVLNGTSLSCNNAFLALNWRYLRGRVWHSTHSSCNINFSSSTMNHCHMLALNNSFLFFHFPFCFAGRVPTHPLSK